MKEIKMYAALNSEGKILFMVPVNKAVGKLAETKIMIARLLTQEEVDRETREAMQDGCHTYERVNRRVRQKR